jgi:hypothetical protein
MGLGAPGVGGPARAQRAQMPRLHSRAGEHRTQTSRESRLSLRKSDSVERLGQAAPPGPLNPNTAKANELFLLFLFRRILDSGYRPVLCFFMI